MTALPQPAPPAPPQDRPPATVTPLRPARPAPPPPEALAFLSPIDSLVNERAPRLLRLWPALGAALMAALLLTAAFSSVDIVVAASGRLTPDAPPVVLQPATSATLRELRVRPGDRVEAGQVVAVLDATFTAADRQALEAQRRALTALRDRLEGELIGAAKPPAAGVEQAVQGLLRDQREGFVAARRAALEAELAALAAERATEAEAAEGLAQQLAIALEVEAMRARLEAEQVGSKLNRLGATASRLEMEQARRRSLARLDELAHRETAARAALDAFLRDWERQALEELSRVGPELARVEELLAKAARLDALTLMRAPAAGVVLEVGRRAPGSLVREGEAVVTITPLDAPMIAEVVLRSADVGWLQAGDLALLKIDAFPWRRFGALEGRLRAVSRESWPAAGEQGGPAMHRGQIEIDAASLPDQPSGAALTPGMTLSAEIKVGARSVLQFFLDPILQGLQESLREP